MKDMCDILVTCTKTDKKDYGYPHIAPLAHNVQCIPPRMLTFRGVAELATCDHGLWNSERFVTSGHPLASDAYIHASRDLSRHRGSRRDFIYPNVPADTISGFCDMGMDKCTWD